MIKILANDGIAPDAQRVLEEAGFEVQTEKIPQDKLAKKINDYDVIIVRSATKVRDDIIDAASKLKIIARAGVGLDNIDVVHAENKGVKVINTPSASSQSVAELALGHMLAISRMIHLSNREMSGGDFKGLKKKYAKTGGQLMGKTLGVIGLGRIGRATARLGLGMGMKVIGSDMIGQDALIDLNTPNAPSASIKVRVPCLTMDDVLAQADYVSLHVPAIGGKPVIGAAEIAKMKEGAVLINCARGGVVDEAALLAALDSGHLMGAGLDTFENEPTPRAELLNHPRISVTPHTGASTATAQDNIGFELADQIIAFYKD